MDKKHKIFQFIKQSFKFSFIGLFILSLIFVLNHLHLANRFPIKTVKVYGLNHVDRKEVKELLLPIVKSGFFNLNIEFIRDRLVDVPWISHLHVRRIWPDKVEVTIVEKAAVALWNNDILLSSEGELFTPRQDTYPSHLPKFIGPAGKQMVMLRFYSDMNRLLQPMHAKISLLELTPYFSWKITLNNGMTLQIGHKDVLTRLDHFVKVYPKIVGNKVDDVEYVDLRYPNGLAIRWKETAKA